MRNSALFLLAGLLPVLPPSLHAQSDSVHSDSAFRELQSRGALHMGVDQYTSAHQFETSPDGGRIELQRDVADSTDIAQIRRHLQEIRLAFERGDFRIPGMVHDQVVPGTAVMTERHARIRYQFRELPRGGEVRITSSDPKAIEAIHDFLAFQRREHRTDHAEHRM
ncbi:MAG: hypothetical protein ABI836_16445 [Gemmatimonadota bacterium]